jgi:fibronectin-binding autotransporter adhesin
VVTSGPLGIGTVNLEDGIHLSSGTAASRTFYNAVNLNGNIEVTMTGASSSVFSFSGGLNVGSGTRTISIVNSNGSATNTTLGFGGGVGGTYSQVTGSGVLVLENGNAADTPIVSVRVGNNAATFDYAVISSDLTIGSGVTVAAAVNNVFTLDSDVTVNSGGYLNLSNNGGASTAQTIGSLSGAGTVYNASTSAGSAVLTIDGGTRTTRTTFSGVVQNGTTGSMGVTKNGSTTQVLSGANNYTGATIVNGGTLLIDGTHIQTAAGSGYTVNSGATLGGTGRISRFSTTNTQNAVLVSSGGILAPGDGGTGTLALDGVNLSGVNVRVLNMASGAKFSFDLAGDGTSADQVAFWNYVSGDLLLNSNAINLSITGTLVEGTYTVSIFKFYSNDGTTLTTSGITSGLTIGTLDSHIQGTPTLTYNSAGGTIDLTYTVVPEPSTWALAALGLTSILVLRRRQAC